MPGLSQNFILWLRCSSVPHSFYHCWCSGTGSVRWGFCFGSRFVLTMSVYVERWHSLWKWASSPPLRPKSAVCSEFWRSGRSRSIVVVLFVADVLKAWRGGWTVGGGGQINFLIQDPEGLKSPEGMRTYKNTRVGVQKTHFIPPSPWYLLATPHKYGLDVVSTLGFCHWEQSWAQMRIDVVWRSQALWTGQNKSVHGY